MIFLVTGVPGAGKTLRAIEMLIEFLKQGRVVYSNIAGLLVHGVMPAPDDWREVEDGAVVIYDEAQTLFPADGSKGRSERDDISAMETHRHRGMDLVLVTQHPGLIHSHVKRLVGRHHHLFRMFGSHEVKMYTNDRCMAVDSLSDLRISQEELWRHPKQLFKLYKSATVHTHKLRLPKRLVGALVFMLLLAGGVAFMFNRSGLFARAFNAEATEEVVAETPAKQGGAPAEPLPVFLLSESRELEMPAEIGGCVSTETHCRCYDPQLVPLDLEDYVCREVIARPLPRRLGGAVSKKPAMARPPPAVSAESLPGSQQPKWLGRD